MHNLQAELDVVILGGGLAGGTLAVQLLRADPKLKVLVVDRLPSPLREAAFKVGESCVEIGAHYLVNVLGLKDHIQSQHLQKFGFRYFLGDDRSAIESRLELGVNIHAPTATYQIDRGRLENHLRKEIIQLGGSFLAPAIVKDVEFSSGVMHLVTIDVDRETKFFNSRWVVDATGRNGFLKRRLKLQKKVTHNCNASWWRVKGRFDLSEWCTDPTWKSWENGIRSRWYSTNHLMGEGYWVWLIPLASGFTSVGIVADENFHPSHTISTYEKSLSWLREHEPQCAQHLDRQEIADFLFIKDYAYGCKQVFSGDRWALTGEAGVFLDPFYSPGSDFICISNTFITDFILRDKAGQDIEARVMLCDQIYLNMFEQFLLAYEDQYQLFGNAAVMPLKIVWDYAIYWSCVAPLIFEQKLVDLKLLVRLRDVLDQMSDVNQKMQGFFRKWATCDEPLTNGGRINFFRSEYFFDLNRQLSIPEPGEFCERFESKVQLLKALAVEIRDFARSRNFEDSIGNTTDWGEPKALIKGYLSDLGALIAVET